MSNTKVTYMYPDASNYKFWGEFIIEGVLKFSDVSEYIFDEEGHFVPHEIGLDHLLDMPMNEDDHYLHTFQNFEPIEGGEQICTAEEFIDRFVKANEKGWLSSIC